MIETDWITLQSKIRCTNPRCNADAAEEKERRIELGGRPAKLRKAGIPFPVCASLDDFGEVPTGRFEWRGTWTLPDRLATIGMGTVKFR